MVRLIDRPDMNLDVYRGRKTTTQQQVLVSLTISFSVAGRHQLRNESCKIKKVKREDCPV